jgi:FAD/FMN-containing dehydrogenase
LVHEVRRAEHLGVSIVPVGARYALARPHASRGLQLRTDGMRRRLGIRARERREDWAHRDLFRCEAGASVQAINLRLAERGLALPTMGAFARQTIGGAVSTSTHGSGLATGPMCDAVVSAEIVSGGGRALRVEPNDGPTDPRWFSGDRCELVKDDTTFYSVVAGLGAAGALYSLTLSLVPDETLEETRTLTTFEELRNRLRSREYVASFRDLAVLVNPNEREGRHLAAVTAIKRAVEPQGASSAAGHDGLVPRLVSRVPVGACLTSFLRRFPGSTPLAVDLALTALRGRRVVGRTAEVLAATPLNETVKAQAVELSVPFENAVPAAEAVFALARDEARRGRVLTAPMTLRFQGPSSHLLSPQYGRESATIELIVLSGTCDEDRVLSPYVDLLAALGGRIHFGLCVPRRAARDRLLANIPSLALWRRTVEALDPRGTFVHRLVRQSGLR